MKEVFPEIVTKLPKADIPLLGIEAYLSQSENHQIIFMKFNQDVELPEHSHAGQWGVVLEGQIDLVIDGEMRSFKKGDHYYIPAGVKHSGKIHAGYTDITFFDEKDRYQPVKD